MTIDLEEYFHATNLDPVAGPARWHSLPSRVEFSTHKTLELLARNATRATFFVLGYSARRHRALILEIAQQGHEIASHGYGHRLSYDLTPKAFFRDVRKTKFFLEDLIGQEVLGYRAPNFSITDRNLWAYDELIRAGYRYDSSVYPVRHPRYGNLQRSVFPEVIRRAEGEIVEFPLATAVLRLIGSEIRLPVAGGAWWRLFPMGYLTWALRRIEKVPGQPLNCYFHPWEIDPGQPRFDALPRLSKLRHYSRVDTFDRRLEAFMKTFAFGRACDVLRGIYPEKIPTR